MAMAIVDEVKRAGADAAAVNQKSFCYSHAGWEISTCGTEW
jgi:hypothetical protein